jgi:Transposase IS66 family
MRCILPSSRPLNPESWRVWDLDHVSGLRRAIEYMGGMWDAGLLHFLDDTNVPIDNNGTERCLRGVVVGRKNHYGSRSQRGTEVAALLQPDRERKTRGRRPAHVLASRDERRFARRYCAAPASARTAS